MDTYGNINNHAMPVATHCNLIKVTVFLCQIGDIWGSYIPFPAKFHDEWE